MATMKGIEKSTESHQRGATVVEFAVVAALLLVIVFAILEFAMIFMQNHLVENAAREGVRKGVVANNYLTFNGGAENTDRTLATDKAVAAYLNSFYAPGDITVNVAPAENSDQPMLRVIVEVDNFMPSLLLGRVPGYTPPDDFAYTATGFYEDPAEYDQEQK